MIRPHRPHGPSSRPAPLGRRLPRPLILLCALSAAVAPAVTARADTTYQPLPFSQDWSNTALLNAPDNWSQVPGIVGYLGENVFDSTPGRLARTIVGDSASVPDLIPNQSTPATLVPGGVAEFQMANPVVALQGSSTADYPHLVLHLNTQSSPGPVIVQCRLRDIDGSGDNAVQQIVVQYRPQPSGDWINAPGGQYADVTAGPNQVGLETQVAIVLPGNAGGRPQLQIRFLTTNAVGNDEWVGIDDIVVMTATSGVP
jgi:hypothetical protein